MTEEKELLVLNLSYNYPVQWGTWKVFTDFIQNFYDAVGYESFHKMFVHSYENNVLTMEIENHPFELDWLLYIGASSKRNGGRHYAGRFGEGFKIAALIARRDHNWDITMESKDWKIHVSEAVQELDGKDVSMMAYEKIYREDDRRTLLTLSGVSENQYEIFQKCVCEFYYPENPLFGECIEAGEDFAVFKAKEGAERGRIYASLLQRQSIPVPVIFCHHSYQEDRDRDRAYFGDRATMECIKQVIRRMEDENILVLLEVFQPFWQKTKQGRSMDMGEVLRLLINRVAGNALCRQQFMGKYGDKIITNDGNDFCKGRSEQRIALLWYRSSEYSKNTAFVIGEFSKLGIKSLDALCRENNGYVTCIEANEREQQHIQILKKMAREIFGDLICYEHLPQCKIIINDGSPVLGQAYVTTENANEMNAYGMKPKSNPQFVAIQKSVLCSGGFPRAMAVYMHELLHQYGDDASMSFRQALLYMNQIILNNLDSLEAYQREWDCLEEIKG